jgi:hypothetical protein
VYFSSGLILCARRDGDWKMVIRGRRRGFMLLMNGSVAFADASTQYTVSFSDEHSVIRHVSSRAVLISKRLCIVQ